MNVAAIDESPSTIGIADSNIYFTDSLEEVREHLNLMESLGVKNVRLLVPWIFMQPQDPMGGPVDWEQDLNWAKLDEIVREAHNRGMGILGVLQWSPDWATEGPVGSGHPANPQDFADFAAAVADRYRDEITAYEVWNEPNASFFWNPVDPVEYTKLLKATYNSLKAVNPEITVVGAVVSATLTWGETTMNPVDFVEAMYAAGADGFFDALSFHPYNFDTKFSEQDEVDWRELMPLFQVQKLRHLLDQHLDPGEEQIKIWISEYGLPTSVVSPEKQQAFIADLLKAWQSFSGGGPIFMYTTKDDMSAIGDERFFGLFDEHGNFKGSAQAFRDFKRLIDCLDGCSPENPLAQLVQFIGQLVTQVLTFVPNLVASVVSTVANLIGSILGGLSGASTAQAAGASLMAADDPGPAEVAEVTGPTDVSIGGSTADAAVPGEVPVEAPVEVPAEGAVEVPAEEVPVAEVPVEEVPAEEVPVVEVPTAEVPVEEVPAEEVPVVEVPTAEVPVEEVPVAEVPVEEVPAEEVPVVEVPAEEAPIVDPVVDPVTEPSAPDTGAVSPEVTEPVVDSSEPADMLTEDAAADTVSEASDELPSLAGERSAAAAAKTGPRTAERPSVTRARVGAAG
ncbi:cellulase family glycosylhydrolase [Mycobacterium sp. NPDC003323]